VYNRSAAGTSTEYHDSSLITTTQMRVMRGKNKGIYIVLLPGFFDPTWGIYWGGAMHYREDQRLCEYCDRLTCELNEAFNELSHSNGSAA